MTSTNDGKDVKSNQTSGQKGKTYYIELYKTLEAGLSGECKLRERTRFLCEAWRRVYTLCQHSVQSTQDHLISWLQRHTSKTLLQTEWQSPENKDEHAKLDEAISAFISECQNEADTKKEASPLWQTQLVQRGQWFKKILSNPWGNPVLKRLLDPQSESPTNEEVLEWLREERGLMFLTRLRQLAASKCNDIALTLASAVMDRVRAGIVVVPDSEQVEDLKDKPKPEETNSFEDRLRTEAGFTADVWELLTDIEFVLLHKGDKRLQCIQLAKQTPLRNSCFLVERLHSRLEKSPSEKKLWKNAKDAAILVAQVVVARCMVAGACAGLVRSALQWCARVLARSLPAPRLRAVAASLAAPAHSARHLHALAHAVHKELKGKNDMIPYMCELYVRAITAGMNELERLKLKTEMETEARSAEQTLASWFTQLGALLSTSDRIQCECALTAFSVHPSPAMYDQLKAAPTLPPVALDHLETKEETTSEFGSWANDSRSMTNLVKTSETLNLKQTLHQANVLSTAILTEGEGLGLDPDMCQDIAVLLSGPRLKTLSWDMDRELLLENCRAYMERTSGGTRAVTTELKYLNLDPKAFQHLPEEDDEENDMFYGIEKGYEHLVEFQEPDDVWEGEFIQAEIVDSPYESSQDSEATNGRRKKKNRKINSSDEDSDPLSFMAEAKRKEKKKVRPHSKERSKERRKKKSNGDPLGSRDGSQDSRTEPSSKEKKKEKKERKKRESRPKQKSLSQLVGMKITNMGNQYTSMTDSDYDSQGKSSLNSLNSESTEDVVFDGLYSMDELKSPEHSQSGKMELLSNNEFSITDGVVAVNKPATANKDDLESNAILTYVDPKARSPILEMKSQPYLSSVREEVKKSISRLIEFRRKKKELAAMVQPQASTLVNPNASTSNYRMPTAIVRPESPLPVQISPKVVTIPEIPKMYISKKQSEQLTKLKHEVNRYLNKSDNVNPPATTTQLDQPEIKGIRILNYSSFANATNDPVADILRKHSEHIKKVLSPARPMNMVSDNTKKINPIQNIPYVQNVPQLVDTTETTKQKNFQEFLKELQESINAGAGVRSADKVPAAPNVAPRREIKPMHRPTPVVPINMKIDSKNTLSAKPQTSPKKLDTSLNTFSRLSYMHKNKQSDTKLHKVVNALIEYQDQNLKKKPGDDRVPAEQKIPRSKCPNKNETVTRPVKSTPIAMYNNNNLCIKKVEKKSTSVSDSTNACPIISSLLQNNSSSPKPAEIKNELHTKNITQPHQIRQEIKPTSLSEKDQNDLLLLLRQQNKLNASYTLPKHDVINNEDGHNTHATAQNSTCAHVTSKKINRSVEMPLSNKDMQAAKPIIYESYKPKPTSVLTGIKVLNSLPTLPKPSITKTAKTSQTKYKTDPLEQSRNDKIEVKTENKINSKDETSKIAKTATDWERVMDAIIAQKTPSRGPKALDVALNKSSFEKAFSDSLLNPKLMKSYSMGELTGSKVKRVMSSNETTDGVAMRNKGNHTTNKSAPKKVLPYKTCDSKHASKGTFSKTLSNSSDVAHVKTSKSYCTELSQKSNQRESNRKLSTEELKKQFTCPLPKDEDPFISGIANSDYDLLEELMDDDLRQEIGELSTDEDDYNPSTPNVSKRKNVINEKRVTEAYGKFNNVPISATSPMNLCINSRETKTTPAQMPSIKRDTKTQCGYNNPIQPDPGYITIKKVAPIDSVAAIPINENKSKVQTALTLPKTSPTSLRNDRSVAAENILPALDSSNLYVAAMPKQGFQNVVLLNSDLVYETYPTAQTSVHSTIKSVQPNTNVPSTKASNVALYQTNQLTSPTASPLPKVNCVTAPKLMTTNNVTSPVTQHVAYFNTESQVAMSVNVAQAHTDTNYSKAETGSSKIEQQKDTDKNLEMDSKKTFDLNSNKSCETKVIPEVKEKQVSNIDQNSKISQCFINNEEDQERLVKKRISIINRRLSHRHDSEPIPLSFNLVASNAHSEDINEDLMIKDNGIIYQKETKSAKTSELKSVTNTDIINLDLNKTKEHNDSTNQYYIVDKTNEGDCRRILLRSSNKLDNQVLTTHNPKKAFKSKEKITTKDEVNMATTVVENEKGMTKRRAKKRASKETNSTKANKNIEKNNMNRISKKSNDVVKNQKKINKRNLQHHITSTNLHFPDIERIESEETVLPSDIDKIVHYQGSTEPLDGSEKTVHIGPKPVETELFDDLTQFSCDTVSFENIIKEKALLDTDFHKENTASPIPVLTSTDVETALEKGDISTKNGLSSKLKENFVVNLNATRNRHMIQKTQVINEHDQNATEPIENVIKQTSLEILGLNKDAPFFKQVISEIEFAKSNKLKENIQEVQLKEKEVIVGFEQQKQNSVDVHQDNITKEIEKQTSLENERKDINDEIEPMKITEEFKENQTSDVEQKKMIEEVEEKKNTIEVQQTQLSEEFAHNKNQDVEQKQTFEEMERNNISAYDEHKNNSEEVEANKIADVKQKQIMHEERNNTTEGDQNKPILEEVDLKKTTEVKEKKNIHEVKQNEIAEDVQKIQVANKIKPQTVGKKSSEEKENNHSVHKKDSFVNHDDIPKKSTKFTAKVHKGPEIPQHYKDSIKIEQILDGSKDPLKKCLRIRLPNGRTFKATVHGRVLLNFDALFEEPALKSLLLSNLTDKKCYTLNIKQVSTASADNPNKIVETRIQEINLEPKATPNLVETINLLSDDEDEEVFQYFKTEFGTFKIRALPNGVFSSHQKKFKEKCHVDIIRINKEIYQGTTRSKRGLRRKPIPSKKNNTIVHNPDIIQIDDSSNESFANMLTSKENDEQIASVDAFQDINLKCYVKLINCDNIIKKYDAQRVMKQKCYVDLVRIESTNPNFVNLHTLIADSKEHQRQFQPLPTCLDLPANGRTSPVMEAFELIAKSLNKTSKLLKIYSIKEKEKLDTYLCKSLWRETKPILSQFANLTPKILFSHISLARSDFYQSISTISNETFNPKDLKTLLLKHFQNNQNNTFPSTMTKVPKYYTCRRTSYLLKRKLSSNKEVVLNKIPKVQQRVNSAAKNSMNQSQFIEVSNFTTKIDSITPTKYKDEEVTNTGNVERNCEKNMSRPYNQEFEIDVEHNNIFVDKNILHSTTVNENRIINYDRTNRDTIKIDFPSYEPKDNLNKIESNNNTLDIDVFECSNNKSDSHDTALNIQNIEIFPPTTIEENANDQLFSIKDNAIDTNETCVDKKYSYAPAELCDYTATEKNPIENLNSVFITESSRSVIMNDDIHEVMKLSHKERSEEINASTIHSIKDEYIESDKTSLIEKNCSTIVDNINDFNVIPSTTIVITDSKVADSLEGFKIITQETQQELQSIKQDLVEENTMEKHILTDSEILENNSTDVSVMPKTTNKLDDSNVELTEIYLQYKNTSAATSERSEMSRVNTLFTKEQNDEEPYQIVVAKTDSDVLKTNVPFETLCYEVTKTCLLDENKVTKSQVALETTVQNAVENSEYEKKYIGNNYCHDPTMEIEHCDTKVDDPASDICNPNELIESLSHKITETCSDFENTIDMRPKEQRTMSQIKIDGSEIATKKKESNYRFEISIDVERCGDDEENFECVENSNEPLEMSGTKIIKNHSDLEIEKLQEEFKTSVKDLETKQDYTDLFQSSIDLKHFEIVSETSPIDGGKNQGIGSLESQSLNQEISKEETILKNDHPEKHMLFSNTEHKMSIIDDHNYVHNLPIKSDYQFVEKSKIDSEPLIKETNTATQETKASIAVDFSLDDTVLNLIIPKNTYNKRSIVQNTTISYERKSKRIVKRKRDMSDFKYHEKRYRKSKNIDSPKYCALSETDTTYSKEYKVLFDYNSSVKFSYSRSFHKEHIEVHELLKNWPITNTTITENVAEHDDDDLLFLDLNHVDKLKSQQFQSLADELVCNDVEINNHFDDIKEANFNMGFGERSGRVILNLEDGVDVSKVSAATLSDVKQNQPVLQFDNKDYFGNLQSSRAKSKTNLVEGVNLYYNSIQLKNKVKDFFEKTAIELDLMQHYRKCNKDCNEYDMTEFPFGLHCSDLINPPPVEITVQVVQLGQLSVSAAAQNPVTCDPRVTQVSDASPPQCSAENSPQDDQLTTIKTEYTELTTADITLPMVHEYEHHEQSIPYECQESSNIPVINENIPIQTEIKSVVKIELMEEEEKIESNEILEHDCGTQEQETINNMDYSYDIIKTEMTPEPENIEMMYEDNEKQCNSSEEFSPLPHQNGLPEKTDQIAHAMNAAGISTTSETMSNLVTTDAQDYNMLSQNVDQNGTLPNGSDLYPKSARINALALQQALAQILPPPLNQTNGTENNQQASNAVTSQVLHIVQGKNASKSKLTLVDNAQPSVINAPNATPVLHIVQNKNVANGTPSATSTPQTNAFSGLSLVDAALQKGGSQLLHIVNAGNQNNNNAGQLLKRVNLLTNLTNAQGGNEQKMVQFVCKSADGKPIQLNASHQRSMVLRLQPVETPTVKTNSANSSDNPVLSPSQSTAGGNNDASQEIKSRSVYEENYTSFIQGGSTPSSEKGTSLPKFNQAFGKQVYQEDKQNELNGNQHLSAVSSDGENVECPPQDNPLNLDQMGQINSPPLLLRKSPTQTTQSPSNIVQQIKETIAPMNIQTMHGGVIYTRQIPVNIGGGQTINLITVPTTEMVDESGQKQQTEVKFVNQSGIEPSIIKIVPQAQPATNGDGTQENSTHAGGCNENNHNSQPQPVLTQMRIKLPMLSKAPNMVSGARVIRPSFFHIQRNVIGGANQQVYQQLVLTAASQLSQQTIRLPQAQNTRPQKTPENPSTSEPQMSTSTLEQLREFDLVLEQVKERSTVQPNANVAGAFSKINTTSTDTTDSATNATSKTTEATQQQVLYSIGNNQQLNVAYVTRKTPISTPTTSTYVRSPDSSGIVDSSTSSSSSSSSQASTSHAVTTEARTTDPPPQPKKSHKSKSRPKASSNPPNTLKLNTPPKPSSQKPLEDEQTTQRILYILAEYKEQVENCPDKNKPAPRRRNNLPTTPSGSSKRKKGSGHRRLGPRDLSPIHGDETCRTMGSEDSSCGTSLGDCNDSCIDSHSPQESPRKFARKLSFDNEPQNTLPRPQPQRNVIVADGQTITVARSTAGKPTAVLMPANYILPVSMVKGGQQIAIVTNRGPKLLTVSNGGEGGTTNALLLQRLIGPAGLKPVLARPGFRHVRLPAAALHNLQAFNLATATTVRPPATASSPAPAPTPPDLVETRATSSLWADQESQEIKPERGSSPECSEPWNLHAVDPHDYSYEETVRTENMDRTVLVVHKREGRQHRLTHVSAAALRHKYAILEHELRLQCKEAKSNARPSHFGAIRHRINTIIKSLSEECEDLGVDSPSASELFPEAELLFTASPAHDHAQEHSHSSQPIIQIPKPDLEDQIATDRLISRDVHDRPDLSGLEDVGIVTVSEDGMQATIALDQEEFARAHPNTTFHSEPSEDGEVQPITINGLKGRHITSTIFHANRAPGTVLVAAPQTTVISQATAEPNTLKYVDIENMIDSLPGAHNNLNLPSVLVKDDGLSRFDSLLAESREVHIPNTTSAIVHSSGNATQVIRRVCFDDDKREKNGKYLIDEPDAMMGNDTKLEDLSRDARLGPMHDDGDDRSSPERHPELFWDTNTMTDRIERRRRFNFSSDSDKCCKSPTFEESNSDSGVGVHMRLDSVIKEARVVERTSLDGPSIEDHPPLRTYPAKRLYHNTETEMERSLSGKTRAGARSPDMMEVRRRSSVRGVVKRGCHCCNGSPAPPRPKKPRPKKSAIDYTNNN